MRNKLLILIILLSLVTLVAAEESHVSVSAIDNHITLDEFATFELTIENKNDNVQKYSIFSLQSAQGWNVDPSPLKDKIIEVAPGQSYTTKIMVKPLEDFKPGLYGVSLNIDSDFGEKHIRSLDVFIGAQGHKEYLPTIKDEVDMDEKINPGETISVKLFLENRNPLDMKDLVIRTESEIKEFVKEFKLNLPPLEKKSLEFSVTLDKFQQPKKYLVFFIYELNGEQVKVVHKNVEVRTSKLPFTYEKSTAGKYLKTNSVLNVRNEGNVKTTQLVKYPINVWQALFTFGEGKIVSDETGRFLTWTLTLSPDETSEVYFVTNYRVLIYLLIVALIVLVFYLIVRSPVVVKKQAVTIKSTDHGALSALKITLEIQNKSKKSLKDLAVIDFVPAIANVEKSLELGTLKPKEIRHTKKGTKVHWSLAELDAHEHRIITYKVKAKLNILGTFSLPRATVEFKTKRRKKRKAYSNLFRLGI